DAAELVVEHAVLEDDANAPPHTEGVDDDVTTVHERLAGGRTYQGGEDADGGRLAGAVGPQEAEDLALVGGQRHAPQRRDAIGVRLPEVAHPHRIVAVPASLSERLGGLERGLRHIVTSTTFTSERKVLSCATEVTAEGQEDREALRPVLFDRPRTRRDRR